MSRTLTRIYASIIAVDARSHGIRGGVTVGTLLVICLSGVLLAVTVGVYDLQVRLERWDSERHAED